MSGLLFSPGKSIFVYCPAALLSLAVFQRLWGRHRNEALFVSAVALSWLALHAKLQNWYGSWGWGPRHFVTIVPCLVLPFLVLRSEVKSRAFKALTILLLSFGFILGAASIITNYQYRLALAEGEHRIDDHAMVWSLPHNQAVDVLLSAARNLRRTVQGGPYEVLPRASQIDIIGSNTINLWLFTAYRLGAPIQLLVLVALVLLSLSACGLWMLLRTPHRLPSLN